MRLKWCTEPEGLMEHIELWFSGLSRFYKEWRTVISGGFFRLMDAHFFYFFLLVDNDAKAQRAALLCPCVWMFLLRTFWSVFVYPCTIQPQNINLYGGQSIWAQSTFQLSVEGWGGGGMWGNVFRQTAGRLGQRTVHKTTPNLILEPKTGSIYIQNREWQKAALSETSDSHLPH